MIGPRFARFLRDVSGRLAVLVMLPSPSLVDIDLFLATVLGLLSRASLMRDERRLVLAPALAPSTATFFLSCANMVKLLWLRLISGADLALSCILSSAMRDWALAALRLFLASHSSCRSTTVRFLFRSNLATTDSGVSKGLPDLLFHSSLPDVSAVRLVSKMKDCGASSGPFARCELYMY